MDEGNSQSVFVRIISQYISRSIGTVFSGVIARVHFLPRGPFSLLGVKLNFLPFFHTWFSQANAAGFGLNALSSSLSFSTSNSSPRWVFSFPFPFFLSNEFPSLGRGMRRGQHGQVRYFYAPWIFPPLLGPCACRAYRMFQISYLGVGNGLLKSYLDLCDAGESETNLEVVAHARSSLPLWRMRWGKEGR